MNVNIIKNILILTLSLLSIHLSGKLWFENISDRNFFYFFLQGNATRITTSQIIEDSKQSLFFRTIVNFGNNTFEVNYKRSSPESYVMNDVISAVLADGTYVDSVPIDWHQLLSNRSIIYDYKIPISSESIVSIYSERHNQSFTNRIKYADMIIAMPSTLTSGVTRVFFINTSEDIAHQYSISGLSSNIFHVISEIRNQDNSLLYISSVQNGFSIFDSNIFIPRWLNNEYVYNTISLSNPYGSTPLMDTIEPIINRFFENPALRTNPYSRTSTDEYGITHVKEYIYSSDTVVIKYYPNSVLEYSDFQRGNVKDTSSFSEAYMHAIRFMKRDITILNDIYLAGYEVKDNAYTFFFDYSVNNFPVLLPPTFKVDTGLSHAIQITVQNNVITHYKRFIAEFNVNYDVYLKANVSFSEAIDASLDTHFLSVDPSGDSLIKSVLLGYRLVEREDSIMSLAWKIKIDNTIYMHMAQ